MATGRITFLLNAEDGPWDIVIRIRMLAGSGFWGQLLDCFNCLSFWVAAPFALALGLKPAEKILLWPALSAGAMIAVDPRDQFELANGSALKKVIKVN